MKLECISWVAVAEKLRNSQMKNVNKPNENSNREAKCRFLSFLQLFSNILYILLQWLSCAQQVFSVTNAENVSLNKNEVFNQVHVLTLEYTLLIHAVVLYQHSMRSQTTLSYPDIMELSITKGAVP